MLREAHWQWQRGPTWTRPRGSFCKFQGEFPLVYLLAGLSDPRRWCGQPAAPRRWSWLAQTSADQSLDLCHEIDSADPYGWNRVLVTATTMYYRARVPSRISWPRKIQGCRFGLIFPNTQADAQSSISRKGEALRSLSNRQPNRPMKLRKTAVPRQHEPIEACMRGRQRVIRPG
jgi:hypothetical protein